MAARTGQPTPAERTERMLRALTQPDSFLLVATAPKPSGARVGVVGVAVGMPALADDGAGPPIAGHCHVSAVFVRPEWWGRRVGGRLIDAVLAEAAARGYRTAQLWTQVDNERALRLYASRGFVRSGRAKTVDGEPIVHLALDRLAGAATPGPDGGTGPGGRGVTAEPD